MSRYLLTLSCDDRPGIVAAVSSALLRAQANIVENQQYSDTGLGLFFMRTVFDVPLPLQPNGPTGPGSPATPAGPEVIGPVVRAIQQSPAIGNAQLTVRLAAERCRTLILVSKFDHCLLDLLHRWRSGDLPIDIVGVISNHPDCRELVEFYGLPFAELPVTPNTKEQAESRMLELIEEAGVGLVVLARYMQVLSDRVCRELAGRAINIHHSFLPGFKGARPYHQAHDRGVKLIGATAHYVTAELDEGPIIEQDVVRVTHAETPERLVALGRDVERRVLSRAVRDHAEGRVFLAGHRTIVF